MSPGVIEARARRAVCSLALLGFALLALASSAHSAFPGKNGKIAYSAEDPGNPNPASCIFTINPDGTGPSPVGSCPPDFARLDPAWSPDGKVIVYTDAGAVGTVNFDGTGEGDLFSTGDIAGIGWSADGSKFVYSDSNGVDNADIWVINRDGTGQANVTNSPDFDERRPDWSPSGNEIAFDGIQCPSSCIGTQDIYAMNPDGTAVVNLTNTTAAYEVFPSWSPKGDKIAYQRDVDVWSMNADGSGQTNLTPGPENGVAPVWSPDGTKIAFESNRGAPSSYTYDIYVMNADGTGVTRVTFAPANSFFQPQPDWQPLPVGTGYARPKGATPFQTYLTVAYKPCASPNEQHGSPLAVLSCSPPQQASDYLTVGTLDSNQNPAKSVGQVRMDVKPGIASTPADEADLKLFISIKDVRNKDLSDYAGELSLQSSRRITDKDNTPNPGGPGPATTNEVPFAATIPCAPSADTTIGSLCSLTTTADTLVPGQVKEEVRSIWQLSQVEVYDGGADADADTPADNTLFMNEGVFVP